MKRKDVRKNGRRKRGGNRFDFLLIVLLQFSLFSCSGESPKKELQGDTYEIADSALVEIPAEAISKTALEMYLDSLGLKDVQEHILSVRVDLKYAAEDNFTGKVLYKNLNRAYLHPYAMDKLIKAQHILEEMSPGSFLLVYDAARPLSVQKEMYDVVKNTPYRAYVANPERTSLHNYGMAVDITICGKDSVLFDMGTGFDYFGSKAGINKEDLMIEQGVLTGKQVKNRKFLRKVMTEAGFTPIRGEWWHFNACTLSEAKEMANVVK